MTDGRLKDRAFRDALVEHGLLVASGAPGVYSHAGPLVDLVDHLDAYISRHVRSANVEVMRSPPVITRDVIERVGYHVTFPHLLATVHTFDVERIGPERLSRLVIEDREWVLQQTPSDLALTPAACYAVYPTLAGALPTAGRLVDIESWCFRQEPSEDPGRLRAFRMRELVRSGSQLDVVAWRDHWTERGVTLLRALGLAPVVAPATDPFFGRGGRLMAAGQRTDGLKLELSVPIGSARERTAVMSLNYHREHFGETFDIRTASGEVAHTGCVGFGIERLALALLWAHGLTLDRWPTPVQAELWSRSRTGDQPPGAAPSTDTPMRDRL